AERRGRGGQPRVEAERVQEPVEVEAQQELLVPEHGLPERAVQQAHVGEGEASGGDGHDLTGRCRTAIRGEAGQQQGEGEHAESGRSHRPGSWTYRLAAVRFGTIFSRMGSEAWSVGREELVSTRPVRNSVCSSGAASGSATR